MKVDWWSRTGSCGFQGGTAHGGPSPSAVLTPPGAAHGVLGPGGAGRGERGGDQREEGDEIEE